MSRSFLSKGILLRIALAALVLSVSTQAFARFSEVAAEKLASEIERRRARVPEFEFIREQAKKLGVRAWLFGGTASAYAHFVKWDLLRESGQEMLHQDRFTYNYYDIYRSTQDLDIVIDGTEAQAAELHKSLSERFPYFQGNRNAWEVRLLRQDSQGGTKEALVGNPNFLGQNTDSNSTGMIELTDPAKNEKVIRDVYHFESKDPPFLKDVAKGRLHYYYSHEKHIKTARYKAGQNPEIFSAVRYLIKAFQFGLDIDPESEKNLKRVIAEFSPAKDLAQKYTQNWLEKNAPKLFHNAVDVEFAWNTLEKLGLRQKLIKALGPVTHKTGNAAWWLDKEPLRSLPEEERRLSRSKGARTAAELGIQEVAHETRDFLAYEAMTRSPDGRPNVFISRRRAFGESAHFGDGFYTAVGKIGARGTGWNIRFKVDPEAVYGVDFHSGDDGHLVFLNKNSLKIIPESTDLNVLEYFERLDSEKSTSDQGNSGVLEKMMLRLKSRLANTSYSSDDFEKIASIVARAAQSKSGRCEVIKAWLELPESREHSKKSLEIVTALSKRNTIENCMNYLENFAHKKYFVDIVEKVFRISDLRAGSTLHLELVNRSGNRLLKLLGIPNQDPLRTQALAFDWLLKNDLRASSAKTVLESLSASQPPRLVLEMISDQKSMPYTLKYRFELEISKLKNEPLNHSFWIDLVQSPDINQTLKHELIQRQINLLPSERTTKAFEDLSKWLQTLSDEQRVRLGPFRFHDHTLQSKVNLTANQLKSVKETVHSSAVEQYKSIADGFRGWKPARFDNMTDLLQALTIEGDSRSKGFFRADPSVPSVFHRIRDTYPQILQLNPTLREVGNYIRIASDFAYWDHPEKHYIGYGTYSGEEFSKRGSSIQELIEIVKSFRDRFRGNTPPLRKVSSGEERRSLRRGMPVKIRDNRYHHDSTAHELLSVRSFLYADTPKEYLNLLRYRPSIFGAYIDDQNRHRFYNFMNSTLDDFFLLGPSEEDLITLRKRVPRLGAEQFKIARLKAANRSKSVDEYKRVIQVSIPEFESEKAYAELLEATRPHFLSLNPTPEQMNLPPMPSRSAAKPQSGCVSSAFKRILSIFR